MPHIVIISSSVRAGRKSHRVALFLKSFLEENKLADAEILDLLEFDFPLFSERLRFQQSPSPGAVDFSNRVNSADGIVIVTPEYNGGYPSSLKNAVDLLTTEWHKKPVAISTVSDGSFGGTQVLMSLQFSLWKMKAWTVNAMLPFPKVDSLLDETGKPIGSDKLATRVTTFVNELLWCIEAKKRMSKNT